MLLVSSIAKYREVILSVDLFVPEAASGRFNLNKQRTNCFNRNVNHHEQHRRCDGSAVFMSRSADSVPGFVVVLARLRETAAPASRPSPFPHQLNLPSTSLIFSSTSTTFPTTVATSQVTSSLIPPVTMREIVRPIRCSAFHASSHTPRQQQQGTCANPQRRAFC